MLDKLQETSTRHESALHQQAPVKKGGAGRKILWLLIVAAIAVGSYYYWHRSQGQPEQAAGQEGRGGGGGGRRGGGGGGGGAPVPVVVSAVKQEDLPVYLDGLGAVTAVSTVMVNSRVAGELMEVDFKEGQDVQKGDMLALIDPRPYQVALEQAQASLERDQAALKDAKLNQERYLQLAKEGVIAQQQSDTQGATVDQLQGAVAADQASIDSAKLNLVYSHITAPITGRVGLRLVDPGNVVGASTQTSTTTGLLLITQMHPITVIFTLPEDTLNEVDQALHHGTLAVKAMSRDAGTELTQGSLLTIDNTIDPTTGTYKLRATFENKDEKLWPNEFVNARLLLNVQKNALVVPYSSIQNGGQGNFVYVVKPNRTVEARPVTLGITEGNTSSITKGLSANEQVVVDGQDRLRAGVSVDPRPSETAPGATAQAPAAGGDAGNQGAASNVEASEGQRAKKGDNNNIGNRGQQAGDPPGSRYRKGGTGGGGGQGRVGSTEGGRQGYRNKND